MRKIVLVAILTGLLLPSLSYADSSGFYSKNRKAQVNRKWSLEALGWNTAMDGHFKVATDNNPAQGQRIDIKKDTTELDREKAFGINCVYEATKRVSFAFNMLDIKHEGRLGVARTFKGRNYVAGSKFKIKDNIYDFLMDYRLWHRVYKDGIEKNKISLLLGVKTSDLDFIMEGNVFGGAGTQKVNYDKSLPIPYVGLEYGTFIGRELYFKANVRAISANVKDYEASHSDYTLSLAYRLSGDDCSHDMLLDVGYKSIIYDVESDKLGNDIDIEYSGPYIGFDMLF